MWPKLAKGMVLVDTSCHCGVEEQTPHLQSCTHLEDMRQKAWSTNLPIYKLWGAANLLRKTVQLINATGHQDI